MRDANNVAHFAIMQTIDQFHAQCMQTVHHLHLGTVATFLGYRIDELIADAYFGEIDDLNENTPAAFSSWIDHVFNHYVN